MTQTQPSDRARPGKIFSAGDARVMQIALKLVF